MYIYMPPGVPMNTLLTVLDLSSHVLDFAP